VAQLAQALFYPHALPRAQLLQLVAGILDETIDLDVVSFTGEHGGAENRELAIPFLPDMDEVVVDAAELQLTARKLELDASFHASTGTGDEVGLIVWFDTPVRLAKVVIDAPTFNPPLTDLHVVVRSAEPKEGGGFTFGPPIFADPEFFLESPLYGPILGGLDATPVAGGRIQLRFARTTSGSGWLIQYATGTDATKLHPQAFSSTVRTVTVEAAMKNLTLSVPGDEATPDTVLWNYANALLPDVGRQVVSFTPVAQKQLAAALAAVGEAAENVTLPVALRFSAESGGKVAIESKTLSAHYRVRPLGESPTTVSLAGGWTPLHLLAPAARRPQGGKLHLVAKHLGRALNDGSPVPPVAPPSAGVRVDAGHWAAAAAPFAPLAGAAEASTLPLVAVRVPLHVAADAEAVLELRGDAAGAPGPVLAPPVVRQLEPGGESWVSFELATPLDHETGGAPLWVALHTTRGELHWFAAGSGTAKISADDGATWGEVDPLLLAAASPVVQLFHLLPQPPAAPVLQVQLGEAPIGTITLAGPDPADPQEFSTASATVPAALLDSIGLTTGAGRVPTDVLLFSRAVLDLTVATLDLDYNPHGAG
jgi:hypothetical protein